MIDNRTATKLAQRILSSVDNTLQEDGWWGTFTNSVYLRASSETQSAVKTVLSAAGTSPEQLLASSRAVSVNASAMGAGWIAQDYAWSLVDRAAAKAGGDASLLRRFLDLEANKMQKDGKIYYDARSISKNGLFRGLFQMGMPAWSDAQRKLPEVGSYTNVFDPWSNALAAATYAKINMVYAREKGYRGEFSPEVLYAMHNQGAGGFMKLMKDGRTNGNVTNQSGEAQRVIKTALAQNGVRLA